MNRAALRAVAFGVVGLSALALARPGSGQEPPQDAGTIVSRSSAAFYYAGNDMRARVTMDLIDRDGGTRTRVLTMLRVDEAEGGNQRYFMYFHEPGDVRGMTFMVWKYPERQDDRWIFVPAVDLVRRIAADDAFSSFVGSDFTYEDVSGRDVNADTPTLVREERLGERPCYVLQRVPAAAADYARRLSWIDEANFLPLKEEYYDAQGTLFRVFTADRVEEIASGQGGATLPTVTRRTMRNLGTGHRTEVRFDSVAYDQGLAADDFSERHMRRPPREWTR